jgi:hypothetical protein
MARLVRRSCGIEKRKKVGDRDALIDQLWAAIEASPEPEPQQADAKRPPKQEKVIEMLRRPEGATVDEVVRATGWQRHTVRGVFPVRQFEEILNIGPQFASKVASASFADEGLAEVDAALRYAEESKSLWCMPEVLRIKGVILARRDPTDAKATAEEHLVRSLDWAHRQQALAWELRAATSLARLWQRQHRAAGARELLGSVCGRFTEGFATADLREARNLLEQLA